MASSILAARKRALQLLPKLERRRYFLLVASQILIGILDLVGVVLIGLVALLATQTSSSDGPAKSAIEWLTSLAVFQGRSASVITISLAFIAVLFFLIKSGLSAFLSKHIFQVLAQSQTFVASSLYRRVISGKLNTVTSSSTVTLAYSLTTGVAAAVVEFLGALASFMSEFALIAILGVTVLLIDPFTTMCSLILFLSLAVYLHFGLASQSRKIGSDMAASSIEAYMTIHESVITYRERYISGGLEGLLEDADSKFARLANAQARMSFIGNVPKYAFEICLMTGGAAVAILIFKVKSPESAVASLALFLAVASRLMPALLRMQTAIIVARVANSKSNSLFSMIDRLEAREQPQLPDHALDIRPIDRDLITGSIQVEALSIRYVGSKNPAVRDISFAVNAGSSLAIVGPSGAGKTTLVDGLLGLLPLMEGRVEIDGLPFAFVLNGSPGAVAYVPQDSYLIDSTIRRNIALGIPDEDIDEVKLQIAVEKSHLQTVISDLEHGIHTGVGDRGVQLSGGQRQRIGLARAFYQDPKILVLDEATSALDAGTEDLVAQTIQELSGRVTTITIAHRLSTIRSCNQVLYMSRGRMIGIGTFDEMRSMIKEFDDQARLMGL